MFELRDAIEKGLAKELGDDVMDLSVAVNIHNSLWDDDDTFTRIVVRVWSIDITIIKPASRLDMIKAAMPYFIRRIISLKYLTLYNIRDTMYVINK